MHVPYMNMFDQQLNKLIFEGKKTGVLQFKENRALLSRPLHRISF